MSNTVFFSIIIASYNRAEFISKAIQSVYAQEYSDWELIVVDDGSTDHTESIVRSIDHPSIHYYKISNIERGAARNYGLSKSRGLYINYFDSDDLFLPCLSEVKYFLIQHGMPPVAYGKIRHIDINGNILNVEDPPFQSFTHKLIYNNFLACGSVFLRRDVAINNKFNEDRRLSSAEDWELWLRINAEHSFVNINMEVFSQVHHSMRSLNTVDAGKIEERDCYFVSCILSNDKIVKHYENLINLFIADRYTFIALIYSFRNWEKVFYYWRKALYQSVYVVKRKRFWAVLKKMIFRF